MTVRVTTLKGGGIVAYLESQGVSLYYTADPVDPPGRWLRVGGTALALDGVVDRDAFQRLIDGRHPQRATQLGRGYGAKSARGYDVTFNAPKSVSLLWAFGDQTVREQVTAAHDAAVTRVLEFVEDQAHTRRTMNGQTWVVDTRGLTVAGFRQHTSRTEDPHLHTHAVVIAKVQDEAGGWYGLDARMLKHDQRTLSALYHAGLRAELTRRLGVEWRSPVNGIAELAGISESLLAVFSERTGQVEARYQIKLDRFRQALGREPTRRERWRLEREAAADSRPAKRHDHPLTELERRWTLTLAGEGLTPERLLEQMVGRQVEPAGITATDAQVITVGALLGLEESQSTWRRNDVIREIARRIPTGVTVDADRLIGWIERAADTELAQQVELAPAVGSRVPCRRDGRPVTESTLDRRLTTDRILTEEEWLATWAMSRWAAPGARNDTVDTSGLDRAQAAAARAVAGTDPLVVVIGPAGAGKTSMLRSAADGLASHGRTVFGLAPSATAAAVLTAETGIRADTVDKLLWEHDSIRSPRPEYALRFGATVLVDEAGMLATPKLAALARLADRHRWRLVFIGDPNQLGAVGRGGMFAHLAAQGPVLELDRIHRFAHDWERTASLRLRAGDPDVLAVYEHHGRLHDGTTVDMTTEAFAAWQTIRAGGGSVVMLAVSNDTVDRLNRLAQHTRLRDGELDPNSPASGRNQVPIYVGDEIVTRVNERMVRTDRGAMIRNRAGWTVTGISPTGITVHGTDGTAHLPTRYVTAAVELGYAHTVHGAQGITVDRSLLLVDGPIDGRALYVGMTRGRHHNHAYVTVDAHHTARDVLEPTVVADWADRPAIDVRAELHPNAAGRRSPERRLLPDDQLRALYAEREHLAALDPEGHARRHAQLQQAHSEHRQRFAQAQAEHDELIRERIEVTGERAHLPAIERRRLRRALDHRINQIETELRGLDHTLGELRVSEYRHGAKLRVEQRWLDENPGVLERYQQLDSVLRADALTRGRDLSIGPPIELVARIGSPPLHDARALRTWELRAGGLAQRGITHPQVGVDFDYGIDRVATPQPARAIEPDHGIDLGP